MTYYHGTSIPGLKVILPPIETRVLREDFRKKFMDCVFVTPSRLSAANYAKKCAAKAAPKAEKAEKKTRVTFSVRAEVGSKVFLAGCFNNWDPTAKQMEDKKGTGEFTCCINLPKGKYEYKFVIDGVWVADGECPDWVQNDMGSMNSVKIVD